MVWFKKPMSLSCSTFSMKKSKKPYNIYQLGSAVFMILALLWLTISLPYVYESQQKYSQVEKMAASASSPVDSNEEESNPFSNTTEEKSSGSGNSFSEEYLHDHHITDHFFFTASQKYKCEKADTYIAFHGELLVPPPDVA